LTATGPNSSMEKAASSGASFASVRLMTSTLSRYAGSVLVNATRAFFQR
jgi:hypothetical protein